MGGRKKEIRKGSKQIIFSGEGASEHTHTYMTGNFIKVTFSLKYFSLA